MCVRLVEECVADNARKAQDQATYQHRYDGYVARHRDAEARAASIEAVIAEYTVKRERIAAFMKMLRRQEGLVTGFDEAMWYALIEQVSVEGDGRLKLIFKSGMERCVTI